MSISKQPGGIQCVNDAWLAVHSQLRWKLEDLKIPGYLDTLRLTAHSGTAQCSVTSHSTFNAVCTCSVSPCSPLSSCSEKQNQRSARPPPQTRFPCRWIHRVFRPCRAPSAGTPMLCSSP